MSYGLDLAEPINGQHELAEGLQYFGLCVPGLALGGPLPNLCKPSWSPPRHGQLTLTGGVQGKDYGIGPTNRPGGYGEFRMDGTSTTYANVADYPGIKLATTFTVSFWLYVNAANSTGSILSKFAGGAGSTGAQLRGIRTQTGTLFCTEQSTNPVSFVPSVTTWLCITLTSNAAGSTLYSNRAVQATGAAFTQFFSDTGPLRIGAPEATFFGSSNVGISGRVDGILCWNRELHKQDVFNLVTLGQQSFRGLVRSATPRFYSVARASLSVGKRVAADLTVGYGATVGLIGRWRCQPGLSGGALWLNEVRLHSSVVLTPTGFVKPAPHGLLTSMSPASAVRGWGATRRRGGAGELRFDATPYVKLGTSLIDLTTAWSFTAWVRLDDITSNSYCILGASFGDTSHAYFMFMHRADKSGLTFQYTNTGSTAQYPTTAVRNMVADTWTHVALVVMPPNTVDIYMDAQRVIHETSFPSSIAPSQATGQDWLLGSWAASPSANFLKGALDECWLWPRPLTGVEVMSVLQATARPRGQLGPVLRPCVVNTASVGTGRVPPGLWHAGRVA
jgi:hypothetical protein